MLLQLFVCQVSEESCRAQFLVPVTAQGKNRAQASLERAQNLNPMVEVHADSDRVEDKPDDFFLQFDAVSGNKILLKTLKKSLKEFKTLEFKYQMKPLIWIFNDLI